MANQPSCSLPAKRCGMPSLSRRISTCAPSPFALTSPSICGSDPWIQVHAAAARPSTASTIADSAFETNRISTGTGLLGSLAERRVLEDFLEGRDTHCDLDRARHAKRPHAGLVRGLRKRRDVDIGRDEALDLARDLHDLVDADAAAITRAAAFDAADGTIDVLGRR